MIKFQVNGETHSYRGDTSMPLLWFLRDIADLKGTKFGCGKGLCGACTVHLNGQAVRSCVLPVQVLDGQSVTTVEGLSDDAGHSIQRAWQTLNVAQCGYCQSGQMMSAVALLQANKAPSDEDINNMMSGNICRCGTYPRIKKAIKLAADLAIKVN
ncbi:(2Fe-2S)-binding protein [Gilvimarinus agarilyticus]|uniref:(2Fe-2S)-binding protein n=1 Tax=Gilvimarinus sp. 2_MG-2023 TaxID=3062666 RepID=UPI001C09CC13|nr:(2Fe-2S)-binding protein [Gilvimarinus sp. 2_MG-2023]MBU2886361.1 (2Fe-2S)-binding protein [Gilvimarinus agarilyticus]MDO6571040.1 (2Fe-2S)-binding protein [Gilvimarinus sp. 2_MG-2023]